MFKRYRRAPHAARPGPVPRKPVRIVYRYRLNAVRRVRLANCHVKKGFAG
jgi:hypothetical protein